MVHVCGSDNITQHTHMLFTYIISTEYNDIPIVEKKELSKE
jgi:hypothetical protein